jgi:hypothetical protein
MASMDTEKLDSGETVTVEDQDDLVHRIEKVTSALPSTTWLTLAGASLVASLGLKLLGRQHLSLFVGQLTPTLLVLGLYNKLTKVGAASALLSSRR